MHRVRQSFPVGVLHRLLALVRALKSDCAPGRVCGETSTEQMCPSADLLAGTCQGKSGCSKTYLIANWRRITYFKPYVRGKYRWGLVKLAVECPRKETRIHILLQCCERVVTHRMGAAEIALINMYVLILDGVFDVFIEPISVHEKGLHVLVHRIGSVVGARRCIILKYIPKTLFSENSTAYTGTSEEANLCGGVGLKKDFGKLPLLLLTGRVG